MWYYINKDLINCFNYNFYTVHNGIIMYIYLSFDVIGWICNQVTSQIKTLFKWFWLFVIEAELKLRSSKGILILIWIWILIEMLIWSYTHFACSIKSNIYNVNCQDYTQCKINWGHFVFFKGETCKSFRLNIIKTIFPSRLFIQWEWRHSDILIIVCRYWAVRSLNILWILDWTNVRQRQ